MSTLSHDLGTVPRYTKEEEAELGRLAAAGDTVAREQLILSVVPWGIQVAVRHCSGGGSQDDAVSDAMVGVIKAVDGFEPDRGRLTTLVAYCVRTEIWRNSPSHQLIRIPNTAMKDSPSRTAKTAKLVYAALRPHSLNGGDVDHGNLLPASEEIDPAARLETADECSRAWKALATLSPRYRKVIILRVMHGWKLADVGEVIGVTRERVRQIQTKAMKELREAFGIEEE